MNPLLWVGLLLAIGLFIAVLEIFVPSGGILGFLAVMSLLSAVVLAFWQGVEVGVATLGIVILGLPVLIGAALYVWPRTPMGRRFLLDVPTSDEVLPEDPWIQELRGLVGEVGEAKTLMLPSGAIVVKGRTYDAVSEGPPIEAGEPIKIVDVRGRRLLVRPAKDSEPPHRSQTQSENILEQPVDSLGLDAFNDPIT